MLSAALLAATLQAATCSTCPAEPLVIGHRGSGVSDTDNPFAENTLASVENAFAEGADMAEIDVQLTRDGQVVIHHDFELGDTTNLTGCLADYDYATLATADATVGSGAATTVGLPLFKDVLDAAVKAGRKINIEVKVNPAGEICPATDVPALVGATLDIVKGRGAEVRVFVSSFAFEALEESKRLAPEVEVGYLTAEGGSELLKAADRAKAAGFEAINPIFFTVSEDLATLEQLKDKGLRVYPWTVNDPKFMTKLLEAGVDGIITDDVPAGLTARENATCVCRGVDAPLNDSVGDDSGGCATTSGRADVWPAMLLIAGLWIARRARIAERKRAR